MGQVLRASAFSIKWHGDISEWECLIPRHEENPMRLMGVKAIFLIPMLNIMNFEKVWIVMCGWKSDLFFYLLLYILFGLESLCVNALAYPLDILYLVRF